MRFGLACAALRHATSNGPNVVWVAMDGASADEFTEFMTGRWPAFVRFGYGLTGDVGLAEDLAQTALARAFAAWPGCGGRPILTPTCAGSW